MTALEQEVLKLIQVITCSFYVSKLKVEEDDGSYTLNLYLNQEQSPMVINYEGSKEQFLDYIAKDLKKRQIERTSYYKGVKYEWYESELIDNDDGRYRN